MIRCPVIRLAPPPQNLEACGHVHTLSPNRDAGIGDTANNLTAISHGLSMHMSQRTDRPLE